MNEFGAEFDRHRRVCLSGCEYSPTDASARFEHDDFTTGMAQIARGSEAGRAGADDENGISGHSETELYHRREVIAALLNLIRNRNAHRCGLGVDAMCAW